MNLRTFLKSLIPLSLIPLIKPTNKIKVGDIVKWNEWAAYPSKKHLVRLSIVTCVWNDGVLLVDDQRGIHSNSVTVVGHCDSITARSGWICDKA